MRTRVGRFWFEGPWDYTPYGLRYIQPEPGVYAALCRLEHGDFRLLAADFARDLRHALESSPAAPAWASACEHGTLCVAVRYDSASADNPQVLLELLQELDSQTPES